MAQGSLSVSYPPERQARLTALGALVSELRSPSGLPDLDRALGTLRQHLGAQSSELFLIDPAGQELLLTSYSGPDPDAFRSRPRFALGEGYPGIVAANQQPLMVANLADDERYLREAVKRRGYHSYLCAPLVLAGRAIGSLHVAWKEKLAQLEPAADIVLDAADAMVMAIAAGMLARAVEIGQVSTEAARKKQVRLCRQTAGADAATVVIFPDPARLEVEGPRHRLGVVSDGGEVLCASLTSMVPTCPEGKERCIALHGSRVRWPEPCRTLPRRYRTVAKVPLVSGATTIGLLLLGYREDRGPAIEAQLGWLATLGHDFMPPTAGPAQQSPHLFARCLGGLEVHMDGSAAARPRPRRRKASELLAFLLLRGGRPAPSDTLCGRLWPDAEPEAARRQLHVNLHELRSCLEPERSRGGWRHVCRDNDGYFIAREAAACDIWQFRDLLDQAGAAEANTRPLPDIAALLEQAVRLYRGELFEGAIDCEWIQAERDLFRERAVDAAMQLSRVWQQLGKPRRALDALAKAAEFDPLREDIVRARMELLVAAGRSSDARKQYRRLAQALERDSDAPSEETRELHERTRNGGR